MPPHPSHRCRVIFHSRDCQHELCYLLDREVPKELRCEPSAPAGYVQGGRGCCVLPPDMQRRVEQELRFNLQECRRRGYVSIAA
jgi:hypothetical protein